ncbi:MAG: mechanosensitive ion channel, partial [Deltaproteobacteria bacterium]|nr:mechanosensitive ion channel [Deltaproteobacteria bacterium]
MNVRRFIIWTVRFIILALMLTVGYNNPAMAQKNSKTDSDWVGLNELSPTLVGEHTNKLLSSINDTIKSEKRYEREMEGAGQEDRLVLELQIYHLREQTMDDISQLADALLELEKKGSQPKLREEVEDVFAWVTQRLWNHIDRLEKEIDTNRARRTEAKTGEYAAIESDVSRYTRRLDVFYELSFVHIQKMEQIGMDVRKVQENFIRLLHERADELSGRMELALARTEDLEKQKKGSPGDADIVKGLIASQKNLSTNTASLDTVLDLMDNLELNTEAYRTRLVAVTQDISSGLTGTGVIMGLVGQTLKSMTNWFFESGPGYLVKLLMLMGILFVFLFAARIVRVALKKALDTSTLNLSRLARRMLVSAVFNLIMLFGILVALSQLGLSLGPLLAGLGVVGFIVGFALQDTLGNFASGVMILLYRPYDVGDLVDVGGVFGRVEKMSLVSTNLLTLDNQLFVVPNSKIWGDVIKNVTDQDIRRVDMVFGISYSDDIPKAEATLEDILKSHEKVLDEPESMVHLHTLGESSVDFVVRPWVNVDDYWEVYWDVTR